MNKSDEFQINYFAPFIQIETEKLSNKTIFMEKVIWSSLMVLLSTIAIFRSIFIGINATLIMFLSYLLSDLFIFGVVNDKIYQNEDISLSKIVVLVVTSVTYIMILNDQFEKSLEKLKTFPNSGQADLVKHRLAYTIN